MTEVCPVGAFWEAEPEHQDYLQRIPDGYTCHFIRPNWTLLCKQPTTLSPGWQYSGCGSGRSLGRDSP